MTSMWMVQDDDGKYLDYTDGQEYEFMSKTYGQAFAKLEAEAMANVRSGHLVEMVPAKPKVPVSQEEAEMLEKAKNPTYRPSVAITSYSNGHGGALQGNDLEDRLIRAYANGYTVVESTKYNVKVPYTTDSYYAKRSDTDGLATFDNITSWYLTREFTQFTMDEIKHYGLEDCEKEEVTDDEQ